MWSGVTGEGAKAHESCMDAQSCASRRRPAPLPCSAVLELTDEVYAAIVGHSYDGLPLEACGLLGGDASQAKATVFYPCGNVARSSRIYTVDPKDHLRADREAEDRGLEIIGVVHSHTHTEAYPSPTDVAQAPD